MTKIVQISHSGDFSMVRDGIRVFEASPDLKAFALVTPGKLTLTGQTITFPNPTRDLWYHYSQTVQTGATTWTGGCISYTALVGEEWGPGRTQNISDVLLGDMPPYTDYVHARMKLTRTNAPDNILDRAVPTICNGEWIDLGDGAATLIEGWLGIFVREIAFVLDHPGEANVKLYLRKLQSIRRFSLTTVGSNSTPGWRVGSSNTGVFAHLEQDKDPSVWDGSIIGAPPGNWLQKGGTQPCKSTVSGDWSSTFTGDLEITPGRVTGP